MNNNITLKTVFVFCLTWNVFCASTVDLYLERVDAKAFSSAAQAQIDSDLEEGEIREDLPKRGEKSVRLWGPVAQRLVDPSRYRSGRPRKPSNWDVLPAPSLPTATVTVVSSDDNLDSLYDEGGNLIIPRKKKTTTSGVAPKIGHHDISLPPLPSPPIKLAEYAASWGLNPLNSSTDYDSGYAGNDFDDEMPVISDVLRMNDKSWRKKFPQKAAAASSALTKKRSRVIDSEDEVTEAVDRSEAVFDDSDDDADGVSDEPRKATTATLVLKKKKRQQVIDSEGVGVEFVSVVGTNAIFEASEEDEEDQAPGSVSDSSSEENSDNDFANEKKDKRFRQTVKYVKKAYPIDKIVKKLRLKDKAVARRYIYEARKRGLLLPEEYEYLDTRNDRKYIHGLAKLIKKKKPLKKLYKFIGKKGAGWAEKLSSKEKKLRLNGAIYKLFRKGILSDHDHQYLKDDNTVLKRRGVMKGCILEFLRTQISHPPTQDLKALCKAFVESDYYPKDTRSITSHTFVGHLTDMQKNGRISGALSLYIESCKDQEQARRSRGGV